MAHLVCFLCHLQASGPYHMFHLVCVKCMYKHLWVQTRKYMLVLYSSYDFSGKEYVEITLAWDNIALLKRAICSLSASQDALSPALPTHFCSMDDLFTLSKFTDPVEGSNGSKLIIPPSSRGYDPKPHWTIHPLAPSWFTKTCHFCLSSHGDLWAPVGLVAELHWNWVPEVATYSGQGCQQGLRHSRDHGALPRRAA